MHSLHFSVMSSNYIVEWALDKLKVIALKTQCNAVNSCLIDHGRPQTSFLGWANHFFGLGKRLLNTFHSQILIQIRCFLNLKFQKCQIPGPGKFYRIIMSKRLLVWRKAKMFIFPNCVKFLFLTIIKIVFLSLIIKRKTFKN